MPLNRLAHNPGDDSVDFRRFPVLSFEEIE